MCRLTCPWMALYKPLVSFPLVFDHVQGAGGKEEARRTRHVSFGVR